MVNHPRRSRRTAAAAAQPARNGDAEWSGLLTSVRATLAKANGPLFVVRAEGLYVAYLDNLPAERQVHTCWHCKRFIETYGALVTIADDGHIESAFWDADSVPEFYRASVKAMSAMVKRARVQSPFLCSESIWGSPTTGDWTHFATPSPAVYRERLLTDGQAMAAKREDFKTVAHGLADFTAEMIAEALRVLEAGHLRGGEKFVNPLHWLAELHAVRAKAKDARIRDNLLWRAVATAPEGYCHPRSSMTGTLLEDIAAGLPFAEVKARFDAKMHPLQYQRPQAEPAAGNIANAEKVIEKLGIAPALERRFARLDECQTAWTPPMPKASERPVGGVFAHLKAKGAAGPVRALDAPAGTLTWEKFARTVLPGAEKIEVYLAHTMNFIALTTALNADAPPILKWGNPVAWYVYHGGSPPSQWGLAPGWAKVNAIVPLPPVWGDKPQPHLGDGFVLVIDGAVDSRTGQGNALFPECLIQDLHGVRSTIEAYSRRAEMHGRDQASACGLDLRAGSKIGYRLRVTAAGLSTEYVVDRWD